MNDSANNSHLSKKQTLDLLGITEDLPTLPDRFLKIREIINNPNSSADDISKIIKTDQATTVMILKVANSPAFNPMNKSISTLPQAVARLGTNETADIALSMSLLYGFAIPAGISIIRAFWAHAYTVGMLASHMSTLLPPEMKMPSKEVMFTSGLLHDIGKAILGIRVDLSYFEMAEFKAFGDSLIDNERERFGMDHAEVGENILRRWGVDSEICDIVARHHDSNGYTPARVCELADAFAHSHMRNSSIETVHAALYDGLFELSRSLLIKDGLLPPDEEEEGSD